MTSAIIKIGVSTETRRKPWFHVRVFLTIGISPLLFGIFLLQEVLCVAQGLLQHSAGRGGLLRVNAALQVILKPRNACLDLLVTGAALLCGDKAL